MKKIVMIFAAMAAVLSSCQKREIESVSVNDGKDIVLNICVSSPGVDDTKALIKTGWAANDEISIWYDSNVQETPDLVVTYNGEKWIQKQGATVSGNTPSTGTGKYAKSLYNGTVKVASKDEYTYENNTLTFNIANWKFLTELQIVVKGLTSDKASDYTLACDKFTPLATGAGYTVGSDAITASAGTKGVAVTGISNTDGVAFVFATADYSSSSTDKKDFTFTLKDNTSGSEVTKVYKPNVAIEAKTNNAAIKALTIESSKFTAPVPANMYVVIEAKYDGNTWTTLKWYKQNLAITESGRKAWKGGNASAVKVPGTNDDVVVGDYFQWAAYAGYCGNATDADKGLLLYTTFTNTGCGDASDAFTFKDGKQFNTSSAPYGGTDYTKYTATDSKTTLEATDDVASTILGGTWRMPTSAEIAAMKAVTYWAWNATDKGYYVYLPMEGDGGKVNNETSNTYDKSDAILFFPAAGRSYDSVLGDAGSYGRYWSSSLNTGNTVDAYSLSFDSSGVNPQNHSYRYFGFSVRPVSD